MEDLQALRAAPHLSVSALKAWMNCPRKYKLHYIEKVEPSHRSVSLVFGHAWHAAIGYLLIAHQKAVSVSPSELRDYFATQLRTELASDGAPVLFDDDESESSLITTGERMLGAFREAVRLPERVLHVEQPFRLELFDPETGEVLPMPLIGAIDAVVEESRRRELWELKSGKKRWAQDAVLYDFQPTAYRMAMRSRGARHDEHVHLKLIVTTKTKQPDVQVEELVRTDDDERDLAETAASIVRAVRSGCFHPVRSWMCRQCEYAASCS